MLRCCPKSARARLRLGRARRDFDVDWLTSFCATRRATALVSTFDNLMEDGVEVAGLLVQHKEAGPGRIHAVGNIARGGVRVAAGRIWYYSIWTLVWCYSIWTLSRWYPAASLCQLPTYWDGPTGAGAQNTTYLLLGLG